MSDLATRKLHFIEKYLQIDDETLISKLEAVLQEARQPDRSQKNAVQDFVGVLEEQEAEQMKKDIEEACEQIDENEW